MEITAEDSSSCFFIALSFLGTFTSWPPDDCSCLADLTEKAVWRSQVRSWSVAVISVALLCACFIASCVVTYHFSYGKTDKRLSELHTYHSSLTCFSEGTSVAACCPNTWKSFGSGCYFIFTAQSFWSKSQQNCVVMGARLVAINTEAEQVLYFALNFFLVVEENTAFTI
ncbi:C-type lectin domain family 6 member A [Ursus arctos]|uniref:C-type lectin domain family 6 member A n=1 Tax=Ursus arctos TaxID=9644 RepID=UPI001CF871D2|nr:C-type lectin domain family 6 member A [Ursus arctos]